MESDDAYTKLLTKQLSNEQVDREIDRLKLQHEIVAPLLTTWIKSHAAPPSSITPEMLGVGTTSMPTPAPYWQSNPHGRCSAFARSTEVADHVDSVDGELIRRLGRHGAVA